MTRSPDKGAPGGIGGGLALERVSKRYGPVRAVQALDLRVEPGEFVALIGDQLD